MTERRERKIVRRRYKYFVVRIMSGGICASSKVYSTQLEADSAAYTLNHNMSYGNYIVVKQV